MLGAVSKIDRKRLVEKLRRGKLGRSERGALWGTACAKYGYRWADDFKSTRLSPGHTTFAIDDSNAATIRKIFEWADQGKAIRWIARQLDAEHATTPSQAAQVQGHAGERTVSENWRHVTVLRILSDPAYCGHFEVNRRKFEYQHRKNKLSGFMEKKLVVSERDQSERIAVPCPAIVPLDQWERVQAMLANNKKEGRPPVDPEDAVMRGHVFCRCGRRMTLTHPKSAGTYVYVCPARKSAALADACPYGETSIRAYIVNAAGMEVATTLVMFRDKLQALYAERFAGQNDEPLQRIVDGLGALIERKTRARDNYVASIGDISDAASRKVLTDKIEECAREIKEATAQLKEARSKLDGQEQHKATFMATISRLSLFPLDKMDEMSVDDKRFLLSLGGVKVTVEKPGEPVKVDTTDGWEPPVQMYKHSDGSINVFERLIVNYRLAADLEKSGSILL
jgi:hypothetical protein